MRYSCKQLVSNGLIALLSFCASGVMAQTKTSLAAPAAKSDLPSEATVEAFLKQMFGWNQELTWKIAAIKPAEAQGFAEATAIFNTPQGQQIFRISPRPATHLRGRGDVE